jgi:hypothetical protein
MKKKFHKLWFGLGISFVALFVTTPLLSQYTESSNPYLGFMYGTAKSSGPAIDQSSLYSQGEYEVKGRALAMVFQLSRFSDGDGIGGGYYASGTLGTFSSKFKSSNLGPGWSNNDGIWFDEFDLIGDFQLGLVGNYRISSKDLLFSFRYFNWYNAGGIRSYYGNADDAAAIGLGLAWKNFGLDYNIASDKIPGFLVNSDRWNFGRLEGRYRFGSWDDDSMAFLVGFRYEYSTLLISSTPNTEPDTRANMFALMVTICVK